MLRVIPRTFSSVISATLLYWEQCVWFIISKLFCSFPGNSHFSECETLQRIIPRIHLALPRIFLEELGSPLRLFQESPGPYMLGLPFSVSLPICTAQSINLVTTFLIHRLSVVAEAVCGPRVCVITQNLLQARLEEGPSTCASASGSRQNLIIHETSKDLRLLKIYSFPWY